MAIKSLRGDMLPFCILDIYDVSIGPEAIQCLKLDTSRLQNMMFSLSLSQMDSQFIRYKEILESENEDMSNPTVLDLSNIYGMKAINAGRNFQPEDFQLLNGEEDIVVEIGVRPTKRWIQLYMVGPTPPSGQVTGSIVVIGNTLVLPAMNKDQIIP